MRTILRTEPQAFEKARVLGNLHPLKMGLIFRNSQKTKQNPDQTKHTKKPSSNQPTITMAQLLVPLQNQDGNSVGEGDVAELNKAISVQNHA